MHTTTNPLQQGKEKNAKQKQTLHGLWHRTWFAGILFDLTAGITSILLYFDKLHILANVSVVVIIPYISLLHHTMKTLFSRT